MHTLGQLDCAVVTQLVGYLILSGTLAQEGAGNVAAFVRIANREENSCHG